jgi:HD-GYP domain-containing protein (c-di-GMP phosphodiesterase class II)
MMKVPRSIRGKREELTAKEWRTLHGHPDVGYTLLSPMGLEERIMKMVKSHHENFDGSGYPIGLAAGEIPIEARIVNVIDTFRALITQGPYRRCFSLDEARNEIIKGSGTKFDPKVVSAFVKAMHDLGAVEDNRELVLTEMERGIGEPAERGADDPEDEGTANETDGDDRTQQQEPVKEETP